MTPTSECGECSSTSPHASDWTLVGGQMIFLHALERGRTPPRISTDIDVVVDARVRPNALPIVMAALDELGFEPDFSIADPGSEHRFVADGVQIDVLVPNGIGGRADVRTVGSAEAAPAAGGTFALERSEQVDVQIGAHVGRLPRPDLIGAVVIKARAARFGTHWEPSRRKPGMRST